MKLGKLNTAIRAAPVVQVKTRIGDVAVQKTSLLSAIRTHFTGGPAQETGYKLSPDGFFGGEDITP